MMFSGEKPKVAEKCFIQSAWSYFKKYPFHIHRIESGFNVTYLDHIEKCVK